MEARHKKLHRKRADEVQSKEGRAATYQIQITFLTAPMRDA